MPALQSNAANNYFSIGDTSSYITGTTTGSNAVWTYWNNNYQPTTATTITTTGTQIWSGWNASYTGSTTSTGVVTFSSNTWNDWNLSWSTTSTQLDLTRPAPTREQLEAAERETERQRKLYEEERKKRIAAEERAEKLLRMALSKSQRRELEARNAFTLTVHSKDGSKRHYEISRGRSGNVHLLDDSGKRVHRYCAHPKILCPDADTMLAQKLMLETNEEEFLRVANKHW